MKTPQPIPKRIEETILRVKHLENVEKQLKERAQALQREAKDLESERQGLRKVIQEFMEDHNFTKIRSPNFIVDYVPGNPKLIIEDEWLVPNEYKVFTSTVNRRKLLNSKDILNIPGVAFEETKVIIIKQIK
ncbi:MAG: siphovirus Gp157 family protein [Caryophanon sp.]|nr:siphovirus Gp157 family protein [Caryophanon sp.]